MQVIKKENTNENHLSERQKVLLMTVRQCLIMVLGAIEDYLCIERSVVPQRKR